MLGNSLRIILKCFTIVVLLTLAACSNRSLTFTSALKYSITGKVAPLILQQSTSSTSGEPTALACTSAQASLYSLNANGVKVLPAVQSVGIGADGSYVFSDVRNSGIQVNTAANSISGSYFVEITGCSKAYSRILTGFDAQDVTYGSTVVSSVAQTSQASTIASADHNAVATLINSLSMYSDTASAYTALTSSTPLSTQFQTIFGASPTTLVDAAPTAVSITVPSSTMEHASVPLSVSSSQWSSAYTYAYIWQLDGTVISTSANPTWIPSGNSQGSHSLSVLYGQANGSGQLDFSKPYGTKSFPISISNNILPTAPSFAVDGGNSLTNVHINLLVATGTFLQNCDSFSKLAITQDDVVPPFSSSGYTIVCSQSSVQTVPVTLSGIPGLHTLRLWAMDAAGIISAASQSVTVDSSAAVPLLSFTTPASGSFVNLSNQNAFVASGSCLRADTVTVSVASVSSTVNCTSGIFTANLDLHALTDGSYSLAANSTDSSGNSAIPVTVAIIKDTSVPSAVISGTPSATSRTTNLDLIVSGSGVIFYKFKIGSASAVDCSAAAGYSSEATISSHLTADISGLADVTIRLCVVGRNAAGNYQSFSASTITEWLKDTVVTDFSSLAISPTSPGKNIKPTFTGNTEAASIVQVYSNLACTGTVIGNGTATAGGAFTVTSGSSIGGDGNYGFSLQATDPAGNVRCSSSTISYTLDTTPPTAVLATAALAATKISPIAVTLTFSEVVTGISSSGLTVLNGTVSSFSGSGMNYSFNINPSAQGIVSVSVAANQASDAALNGNLASNVLSRVYDSIAPNLSITAPIANANVNTTSVVLSGLCEAGLLVNVSGAGMSTPGTTPCTAGTFSTTVTLTAGDGGKNLVVGQTDLATNSAAANVSVILDSVAPALTFTSASVQNRNTNSNSTTFTGACESGLSITVAGGVDSSSTTCSSGTWTYTTSTQTTDGNRTYSFKQTDLAGNATTISGTWIRDTVAPVLTLASPVANFSAQTGVTLTGACENGLNVVITGTGILSTITIGCTSTTYSQLVYFSAGDGAKAVTVTQTDVAGNPTAVSRSFVRDTVAPSITQTLRGSPFYSNTSTASFGGSCEYSATNPIAIVVSGGVDSGTVTCSSSSTWTYTTQAQSTEASRSYTFTQTDAAGNAGTISAIWIRDTTPPALTITSSASYLTSSNSVTFSGACESGLTVNVSGAVSTTTSCSAGSWSYATSSTTDGTYNYTFTQTDAAGNSTPLAASWQRSTAGPVITISQTTPQVTSGSSLIISGTCSGGTAGSTGTINIGGAGSGSVTCSSTTSTVGSWTYTANKTTDGNYNFSFTTTDNFTTPRSSSASLIWQRDATPPTITAGSFIINGGTNTTSAVSYNPVNFASTDNLSYVTKFCLKSTATAPLSSDGCWYALNGSATNVTPANSVSVSNYSYNIGITPQAYNEYLWVMDGAGNISTNSAVSGTDLASITLQPIAPPAVSTVLVSNSDTMNGAASERIITGGSDVYVRWTMSGTNLLANPVTISFTTDDSSFNQIAINLTNGANNCSSIQGSGGAATSSTGCYKWPSGSPSSSYYRVRVSGSNSVGGASFANSLPINAGSFQIVAGNTETGLNGSAQNAYFSADTSLANQADRGALAVKSDGTIYFRDLHLGLLYVSPKDGKLKQLIPIGTTAVDGVGDGGSVLNAKLRAPVAIAMDYQDRLLILDYNRIRRVDLSQSPPTISTIIGGGSDSSNSVANPLNFSFSPISFPLGQLQRAFIIPLPNGDIWFSSENYTYYSGTQRIRHYISSSNSISSIKANGGLTTGSYTFNSGSCNSPDIAIQFDPATSAISYMGLLSQTGSQSACVTPTATYVTAGLYQIDPTTGAAIAIPSQFSGTSFNSNNGENIYASTIQAKDGKIYQINRDQGLLKVFNPAGNTWTTLAGTGTVGSCADGSLATSCNMDIVSGFVDANSNIFLLDRTSIRTITAGKIVTIAGQSPSFGDGGLATNARFGVLFSVQSRNDGKFVALDHTAQRLRMFDVGGTISTLAGNDSTGSPDTVHSATSQPLATSATYAYWTNFGIDPSNNDIIYPITGTRIGRLSASTGIWSSIAGGGSTNFYNASNGTLASQITLEGQGIPIQGWSGTNLLFGQYHYTGSSNNFYTLAELRTSNNSFYTAIGNLNSPNSGTFCADGVSAASCSNMPAPGGQSTGAPGATMGSYDSVSGLWQMLDSNQKSIRTFAVGSNISTLTTLLSPAYSFVVVPIGGSHYVYYCSSAGDVYIRNIESATEKKLPRPVMSASCSGSSLLYNQSSGTLTFVFSQNGLYGVAQLSGADPATNGI